MHEIEEGPAARPWSTLIGEGAELRCAFVHWADALAPELAVLGSALSMARTETRRPVRLLWLRGGAAAEPGPIDLLALAEEPPSEPRVADALTALLDQAAVVVLFGPAVRWFASTRWARGLRVALHWDDLAALERLPEDVIVSPAIIEPAGKWTTCCGGAAAYDLGLLLVGDLFGAKAAQTVQNLLCVERVREPSTRQRVALQGALGELVPKLAEAVALMEANVEEPLQSEEIAELVGLSRRQLERLFKQHLNTVPSRYYLDLRLRKARSLLRETPQSLLQIALMCGFSSGSHFSTSYSAAFGVTPRDERQRMLRG